MTDIKKMLISFIKSLLNFALTSFSCLHDIKILLASKLQKADLKT